MSPWWQAFSAGLCVGIPLTMILLAAMAWGLAGDDGSGDR